MRPEIPLRLARPEEAATLTDLSMRAKASNGYDAAFMEVCRAELAVTPEAITDKEYWIAGSDPPLGCVCLSGDTPGIGEVNAYFVAPEAQRQGIGRLLWAKLLERAQAKGIHALRLDSDPFAVPFYEALGFQTIGQTPSGSIPGRVLPRMEYRLPTAPHPS